ncbi:MAG: rane protein [Frankiales bacterium]|nr:rane protein [Frankiales bacterium]
MRIPGGDLAPARRRRYGGGYGRRRRRRNLRLALAVLLVAAGAGAAYALRQDDGSVPQRLASTPCPSPSRTPAASTTATVPAKAVRLPQPQQVRLTVLNGTSRSFLAKTVGDQLAARGFVVTGQANAAALTGASTVTFGPGAGPAATVVSHWVLGARAVGSPMAKPGSVQLVLGSSFTRLATPAEAAAAARALPTPSPSASPTATRAACAS